VLLIAVEAYASPSCALGLLPRKPIRASSHLWKLGSPCYHLGSSTYLLPSVAAFNYKVGPFLDGLPCYPLCRSAPSAASLDTFKWVYFLSHPSEYDLLTELGFSLFPQSKLLRSLPCKQHLSTLSIDQVSADLLHRLSSSPSEIDLNFVGFNLQRFPFLSSLYYISITGLVLYHGLSGLAIAGRRWGLLSTDSSKNARARRQAGLLGGTVATVGLVSLGLLRLGRDSYTPSGLAQRFMEVHRLALPKSLV
jgi:hypothetical protein